MWTSSGRAAGRLDGWRAHVSRVMRWVVVWIVLAPAGGTALAHGLGGLGLGLLGGHGVLGGRTIVPGHAGPAIHAITSGWRRDGATPVREPASAALAGSPGRPHAWDGERPFWLRLRPFQAHTSYSLAASDAWYGASWHDHDAWGTEALGPY